MARVCIDGFNISLTTGSGIATYARNLVRALDGLGHETQLLFSSTRRPGKDDLLNEVALFDAGPAPRPPGLLDNITDWMGPLYVNGRAVPLSGRVEFRQFENRVPSVDTLWADRDVFHPANRRFSKFRLFTPVTLGPRRATDVMHWTCPLPMFETRAANIYTIHDMVPVRLPFATLDNKRTFLRLTRRLARRADLIVTVSEASRRDILELLPIDEDRVVNTYQSVEIPPSLLAASDEDIERQLASVFRLGFKDYFLFFGVMEPKKNLPRIVEAYLASGAKAPLVIVSATGWARGDDMDNFLEDVLEPPKPGERPRWPRRKVLRYNYLPFRMLLTLIRGARATLFPSLYEGFGLPVLESMLLGTPVLTSGAGSLPEVAGDAALVVDAYDAGAIRDGIRALDQDEDLRNDLIARGRLRVAEFTMEKYQQRLAAAYAKVA
ncbi:MAG TPA: glycosyltransferase family 1 protein [Caulobacteraceae bacterium]|jgi:glycosyltransferase involved in cell wall biosynthesis|nr:glycosyltransferase family 1 protein [Caulobacteraceae bacterium]